MYAEGGRRHRWVMPYAEGGPRRLADAVTEPSRPERDRSTCLCYADGLAYAEGGRQRSPLYAEGIHTPRVFIRRCHGPDVRRRPQYLAVGVRHGRRCSEPFL
jgi:hypothetical protein